MYKLHSTGWPGGSRERRTMAASQSFWQACLIVALRTDGCSGQLGNAGNSNMAGVTKDRPGEGAEEGKAIIVLKCVLRRWIALPRHKIRTIS